MNRITTGRDWLAALTAATELARIERTHREMRAALAEIRKLQEEVEKLSVENKKNPKKNSGDAVKRNP